MPPRQTPRSHPSPLVVLFCVGTLAAGAACILPEKSADTAPPVSPPRPAVARARSAISGLPVPPARAAGSVGSPGKPTVLDWAGFDAAVSYTFDDANASQLAHYEALNALGVPLTFFLITGKPEAADATWKRAVRDGHELGNHSRSHAHRGTGEDLDAASAFLHDRFGVTAWTMAAPFGDGSYVDLARTRFLLNRGVVNGLVLPNDATSPFALPCFIPPAGATAAVFDAQIDQAVARHGWRIVLVHGFTGGSDGAYLPVALNQFLASVGHSASLPGLWIDSLVNVGAYWRGQQLVSAAIQAGGESATTWTWTLPPHFPPGRFVRVAIPGSTLAQAGAPLTRAAGGYYEVALDVGSLTVAP